MAEIVLSVNGNEEAKVPFGDSQRSMYATVGDYEVHVTAGEDVLVSICHSSMVPCAICGHAKMKVKPGHWACPGFYGSPMHFCEPGVFAMHHLYDRIGNYSEPPSDEDKEFGAMKARQRLEWYCGCTLEEYLAARNRLAEKTLREEAANA